MSKRLEQLLSMLASSPDDSFILFAIAKEYEKNENLEIALQYYTRLVKEHPDYVGTYYHLGKLYEKMEDTSAAIATYENGMRIAQKLGDKHAHGELSTAKWELE